MTTDSVWLIERVFVDGAKCLVATVPLLNKAMVDSEVHKLIKLYGGEYRAVEYRRVKEGE